MSVNTQALVRSAQNGSLAVDGKSGEGGQNDPKDAAEKFQSMMTSLRDGEASKSKDGTAIKSPDNHPNSEDGSAQGDFSNGSTSNNSPKNVDSASPEASYPVTNLADAIRTVSQTVMGRPADGEVATGTAGAGSESADARPQLPSGLSGALPLGTVLAARLQGSQNQPTAGQIAAQQGAAQQNGPTFPTGFAVSETAAGEGAAKTGTSSLFAQFGIEPEQVSETGQRAARNALPEEAAGTVKLLRQETHFAPNLRLSPAQQIGEQIATALKDMPSEMGRLQGGVTATAEGPVLKTLDIQLTPHELGTVKVSLRMVGDNVEVTLATSKVQTAELLKQDRQLLDQMLRTTGFKADTITIQAADDRGGATSTTLSNNSSAQAQQGTSGGAFGDNQNQNASGNSAGGRGGQTNGQDDPSDTSGYEPAREQSDEEGMGGRLSDGIYL
ncbi:flagellar hook-length control protein FliK [Roseibium sp.]|uniref:flagellar hook-length control protein FliK n=1 Tax=Roseibium sp. TaxID=1936156 RepID=UPI003B51FEED